MTADELNKENHRTYTYHFYFHDGLFYYIQHLKDFIATTESHFSDKLTKILQTTHEGGIPHPMFEPQTQLGEMFPNILWRTTFLHSYFLLESSLDQICKNVQKAEDENISLKDMAGNGIHRSSLYLKKVHNVLTPFETEAWRVILRLNKIRNIFVHADGNADIANKELYGLADSIPGLSCLESFDSENLSLSISKEFTTYALDKIEEFFYDLSANLRPKKA